MLRYAVFSASVHAWMGALPLHCLSHLPTRLPRFGAPPAPSVPSPPCCSGDSSGNVQFWDGRFGTLLARFTQHRADVLQLAASPDGDVVFASGALRCCCSCSALS